MRNAPTRGRTDVRRAGETRSTAPALRLTPSEQRRRWPMVVGVFAMLVVLAGLLGAAVFHTQLAERQLRIDKLERSVREERERFDELRYERAELRSPVRLAAAAGELGMVRGDTSSFVELDPWIIARQIAAAGVVNENTRAVIIDTDPLEQFSDVKRVSAGQL
jgi:Tfp pilus assembly protein PilN